MKPERIVYGTARKRGLWRCVISEYGANECLSTYLHDRNFDTRRDAAIAARELAEEIAAAYNASPNCLNVSVAAMSDEVHRLARPKPVEPTLFALRVDARPAAARDAGNRFQQPGLFDL